MSNLYKLQFQRGKCSLYFLVDETTKKVGMGWGIKKCGHGLNVHGRGELISLGLQQAQAHAGGKQNSGSQTNTPWQVLFTQPLASFAARTANWNKPSQMVQWFPNEAKQGKNK